MDTYGKNAFWDDSSRISDHWYPRRLQLAWQIGGSTTILAQVCSPSFPAPFIIVLTVLGIIDALSWREFSHHKATWRTNLEDLLENEYISLFPWFCWLHWKQVRMEAKQSSPYCSRNAWEIPLTRTLTSKLGEVFVKWLVCCCMNT